MSLIDVAALRSPDDAISHVQQGAGAPTEAGRRPRRLDLIPLDVIESPRGVTNHEEGEMSVMMGLRIAVDVAAFEQMAAENQETLKTVEARSKEMGAIHHRFYGNIDGSEVLVVDEWPDPESFGAFMQASPEIPEMFGKAGVRAEPQPVFWREIDAGDAF